ncbi:hypothetical protein PCE1_001195 [Barthelona sp. PCE]
MSLSEIIITFPLSENEYYKDVSPSPVPVQELSISQIRLSPEFSDMMSYMRGLLRDNERSNRTLSLAVEIVKFVPTLYMVWGVIRDCIVEMDLPSKDFLLLVDKLTMKKQKVYQLWTMRTFLIEREFVRLSEQYSGEEYTTRLSTLLNSELSIINYCLKSDTKSYHAWSYRIKFIDMSLAVLNDKKITFLEEQLSYSENLIVGDFHNNSAWSFRQTLIKRLSEFQDIYSNEIKWLCKILTESGICNESAASYLFWLLETLEIALNEISFFDLIESYVCADGLHNMGLKCQFVEYCSDNNVLPELMVRVLDNLIEFDEPRKSYWLTFKDT